MTEQEGQQVPLFSFGVISDVQYADIPDGTSFHGVPRYYRNALVALQRAVSSGWVPAGVEFGIHFGDIVDGFQARDGQEKSEQALSDVLQAFSQLPHPTYHMLGNHCLYNLPRARLNKRLGITPLLDPAAAAEGASYYAFSPHPTWLFVVLDAYDVSLLGWPDSHPRHLQAEALLAQHNPNKEKNSPEGLVGVARRFVKFGGGVSEAQLAWLEQQLQAAKQRSQNVLVCSHLPLLPDTCPPACLLWNYEHVLQLLRQSGVVVATMAGHTHQNGYLVDEAGIHHLVLPAVLETPPGRDAYGTVEVLADRLLLKGVDTCMSAVVKLSAEAVQRQQAVLQRLAAAGAAAALGGDLQEVQQQGFAESAAAAAAAAAGGINGAASAASDLVVEVADEQQQQQHLGKAGAVSAAAAVAEQLQAVNLHAS
uniref:Manganese-dependent ADP-ribose/CDP-alcohol diphosphatase n=1 Tax=Tetradesmus obliquus TaxID=3088 RepID=A0A383VZW1_TETOB|eukprot:jgi/Sobl393_1/2153/SZX70382.1